MRDSVCWVCAIDLAGRTELVEHEGQREHLEILYKQALGEDDDADGRRRTRRRNKLLRLCLGDAHRDELMRERIGPLWTIEQLTENQENTEETQQLDEKRTIDRPSSSRSPSPQDRIETLHASRIVGSQNQTDMSIEAYENDALKLYFCSCILGWRVGKCEHKCHERSQLDAASLRRQVFKDLFTTHAIEEEVIERKRSLQRGLSAINLTDLEYDARSEAQENIAAMKKSSLLKMLQRRIKHTIKTRFSMNDEARRSRSPLVNSSVRYKSFHKVHVLGHEMQHPKLLIEQYSPTLPAPASEAIANVQLQVRRKTARFLPGIESDETIMESSPLRPSHDRRPVFTRGDIMEQRFDAMRAKWQQKIQETLDKNPRGASIANSLSFKMKKKPSVSS